MQRITFGWRKTTAKILFLAALALIPSFAFAQTPGDQATAILTQMAQIGTQTKQLDDTIGKNVSATEEKLKQTDIDLQRREKQSATLATAIESEAQAWKTELDRHDSNVADQTRAAQAYNARCGNVKGDASFVANCNSQMSELQAWGSKLDAWGQQLQGTKAVLRSRLNQITADDAENTKQRQQLSDDTLAWAAQKKKKYFADRDDLGARFNTLRDKLLELANRYNNCTAEFISHGSPEEVKHKCGNIQFDGASISLEDLRAIAPAWRMQ